VKESSAQPAQPQQSTGMVATSLNSPELPQDQVRDLTYN
jgi:hypothetical protein